MKDKKKHNSSEKPSVKPSLSKRDCADNRERARVKGVEKKISFCEKRSQLPVSANPGMPRPIKPKNTKYE